ncbi:MAG: hypothetical protein K2I70_01640 [Bacilli bacterium]|nr:hypothetical protein [Bacilli bacterium]
MSYSDKQQHMLNRLGTIMICYAMVALVMLLLRGWYLMDIVCFIGNLATFLLFQYTKTDKEIIAYLCIGIGLISLFLLRGLIILFGLLLAIYGAIFLVKFNKQ